MKSIDAWTENQSRPALRRQLVACASAALLLAAARVAVAGGGPMDIWNSFNWSGSNQVTQTVSIVGTAESNITEVVNVGDVNGDGYTDLLLGVSAFGTNRYALILGGGKGREFNAGMTLAAPGLVRCWLVTSDGSGGPHLMRARPIGDIDKDGCADFCVVGSNNSSGGGNCYKWKYIVFGRKSWPTGDYDIGVASGTTPKEHIRLHSFSQGDNITRGGDYAVKLGDLNGDGIDDLLLAEPQFSGLIHDAWHDGELRAHFFLGNTTRTNLAFYRRDNADVADADCDKVWQTLPMSAGQILAKDLDGDGRNDLLVETYNPPYYVFPVYVWKAGNFRTFGAAPSQDTPIPPSLWPGITNEPPDAVPHSNEWNSLLSADAVIQLSGFGSQMRLTVGDVDGDGKANLIWTDWGTEFGWSGGEVVIATPFTTAGLTRTTPDAIRTNTVQFSPQQNWLKRWTKIEGDGWFWGYYGLAYVGDVNGDGVGDLMVDDRFGDIGHGNGWGAGGIRFIAGSTTGWATTTRLSLPLILQGEHDDNGLTKNGDGLGSQIEDIAGFGSSDNRKGFAVMARFWDPIGTNTADYGKVYLFSPFDPLKGMTIFVR